MPSFCEQQIVVLQIMMCVKISWKHVYYNLTSAHLCILQWHDKCFALLVFCKYYWIYLYDKCQFVKLPCVRDLSIGNELQLCEGGGYTFLLQKYFQFRFWQLDFILTWFSSFCDAETVRGHFSLGAKGNRMKSVSFSFLISLLD